MRDSEDRTDRQRNTEAKVCYVPSCLARDGEENVGLLVGDFIGRWDVRYVEAAAGESARILSRVTIGILSVSGSGDARRIEFHIHSERVGAVCISVKDKEEGKGVKTLSTMNADELTR